MATPSSIRRATSQRAAGASGLDRKQPTARQRACFAAAADADGALADERVELRSIPLDDDELVLLATTPSLWFVPLSCLGSLLAIACGVLAMAWATRLDVVPWSDVQAFLLGAGLAAVRLAWQFVEWSQRLYVLTDRRVLRRSGTLRPTLAEERLVDIRHTVVLAARRERSLRIGTVAFVTARGGGLLDWNLAWETVRQPDDVQQAVRDAVERYGR